MNILTYVENFRVVDKIGQTNNPGEGHLIYYKDVNPPVVKGEQALTADNTCIISTDRLHTWQNVEPGNHVFWVQLVNNDNTVLEPPAAVNVPIIVVNK